LHPLQERTELLDKGQGIVGVHKARGGFEKFAVPHSMQICAGTAYLAIDKHTL
jgi:hypothetical protein